MQVMLISTQTYHLKKERLPIWHFSSILKANLRIYGQKTKSGYLTIDSRVQAMNSMNSVVPNYSVPGTVFSIVSVSLVAPVMFVFRQYFRSLDFMQMSYLFGLLMYSSSFSTHLTFSFVNFNYNFLTFCSAGDIVCTLGFQLSFGCVLVGFILITVIFIGLQRCAGKNNLEIEPMYLFLKGFFKWVYLPYTYYSAFFLASAADQAINQSNVDSRKLIEAAAIAGFCLLFPILQLVGYKCIQTQQTPIWRKWLQFFGYLRLMATGTLLGLFNYFQSTIYLHCVMVMLIVYPVLHTWKGEFKYPVAERVLFALGEAAFLANFYVFKYRPEYLQSYDLDFFFLAFVLLIDVFLYLIRGCRMAFYGINQNLQINPETSVPSAQKTEKVNKYEHDSGADLQNSRDTLIVTVKEKSSLQPKKVRR